MSTTVRGQTRPEEAIKNAPTDLLCKAAGTLQQAHDLVEISTFNIGAYVPTTENGRQCCFVGSVHHFTKDKHPAETNDEAAALALTALDAVAMKGGMAYSRRYQVGSTAESFGFSRRLRPGNDRAQETALDVYRQALRMMHTELMSRKDVPVPA